MLIIEDEAAHAELEVRALRHAGFAELTLPMACMMGLPETDPVHLRRGALLHDTGGY